MLVPHIHYALGACLWRTRHMKGEHKLSSCLNGLNQYTSPTPLEICAENGNCAKIMSRCHVCVAWGYAMKFRLFTRSWGTRNQQIHLSFCNVHGCHWFFMMTVDLLWWDNSMYHEDTKILTMSYHSLRMPPWGDIVSICFGSKLEECIRLQTRGVIQLRGSFFDLAHGVWCLIGNECSLTESWSRTQILLYHEKNHNPLL
jgi:hypothetical protein